MTNKLDPIILQKEQEVEALYALRSTKSFKRALRRAHLTVIAEIKRKSPSKGLLAAIADPISLAKQYLAGGADALSILTDENFFGGTLSDLTHVASILKGHPTPILRKDFIIDTIQVLESVSAGADAILCIVAVLGKKTKIILDYAKSLHVDVIVEIHDQHELDIALESGAQIIGVNNRDLNTFQIDTQRAFKLINHIPKEIIRVAESGILNPELAVQYYQAGFDAVLIGEALVTSTNPELFIRACRNV